MAGKKTKEVIFDVETQKWFDEIDSENHADLGVSIVSVYSRQLDGDFTESQGQMQSFWEDEITQMWPLFQEADRVIGFNSIGFDVPVLIPYAAFPLTKLPHFDIMAKVKEVLGHRLSLDAIAKETLKRQKTETGAMGVELWKRGDKESLARLQRYCEADVAITRDIYDIGLKEKQLKYKDKWNSLRTFEVDFSYPAPDPVSQAGLF
ncbi:hypothetical protein A2630_00485 [Candidatus Woesebacteria bacterium RIFCSPHIGHO2_01_FULL_44_10]|uniref:YprB ribonuclease H-like domain-containing protein n=1 Tax=Candidatus Woesebacteria bacterium RIFCSPLOWO2_01_FULL_44_14 TaxID=1802525 RepID=A0A1F8C373_9BACT|nr:MAG: hypothetical protein A2630_00485 [Candidatus Woesebacteria bacterium RIFCSPHIGHO2_01_FULL_44_10]OGM54396.1 MAG: hypothetical protein A3F62_01440 [Candidatus Woesebacteria bacterium RIFCSPHIGHO2_12_FULL_44_11]OGM70299.1 MAG: hypothetical protein A2975_04490 [Candidatus Woesebacteria bacterium RIFCSPLOWO2_01_FULL_44_14]